jgi:hypothetical protein
MSPAQKPVTAEQPSPSSKTKESLKFIMENLERLDDSALADMSRAIDMVLIPIVVAGPDYTRDLLEVLYKSQIHEISSLSQEEKAKRM